MSRALWKGFIESSERFPERPAVLVEGESVSYRQLREQAVRLAATIQDHAAADGSRLTAVFAHRTRTAYAGVLGALLAGNGYVPLNRTFPAGRTRRMLQSSASRSIVADEASLPELEAVLDAVEPQLVLLPDVEDIEPLRARWDGHTFLGTRDLSDEAGWRAPVVEPDALAYLLFTSGSTGTPKGVMVAHRNVVVFVDYMVDRYRITAHDRFSQMFDLTFDLSVFDMFVCWERGACLCCPSQKDLVSPGKFIQDSALTIWFSVPSTAAFMRRLGLLKRDAYSSLRLSLFCGEPLPVGVAEAWLEAAPRSVLENLYGPTELTIACTLYRWDAARSPAEAELGVVPIGYPYPGMDYLVVDDSLREVEPGEVGELVMTGTQMTLGYWRDPQKTAAAFAEVGDRESRYYRTGDRVRRPVGNAPLTHLGRTDFQVKILGHRVELGEVEAVVRDATGLDGVVAVPWPETGSGFGGIEVFVEGTLSDDLAVLRREIGSELPQYMVPRRFHALDRLPRNVNGKFDRQAMRALLEGTA